jgi:hypothetical protein
MKQFTQKTPYCPVVITITVNLFGNKNVIKIKDNISDCHPPLIFSQPQDPSEKNFAKKKNLKGPPPKWSFSYCASLNH